MTNARTDSMTEHLSGFLDRYSPPRPIQSNPSAQQAEADALLKTMLHFAPRTGYEAFCDELFTDLSRQMRTRSWPTNGEMADACKRTVEAARRSSGNSADGPSSVQLLEAWYRKSGSQMPTMGNSAHTAELIRRGVLANEREARWRGFDISPEMRDAATSQPMGRDEWEHHCGVLARLRGCPVEEVKAQERERDPVIPPGDPVKRMPIHRQRTPESHFREAGGG